jgi:argininosuccinate synthase
LCAAADIVTHGSEQLVVQAVASNDGAASDLVGQLLYSGLVASPVALQLPMTHAVTQMALHYQGVVQMATAGGQSVLLGVLDLPMMLAALIPAFEQRLRGSAYAQWNGGVRIEISDERAMIMVLEWQGDNY